MYTHVVLALTHTHTHTFYSYIHTVSLRVNKNSLEYVYMYSFLKCMYYFKQKKTDYIDDIKSNVLDEIFVLKL